MKVSQVSGAFAAALVLAGVALAVPAAAAEKQGGKKPPACAAISFRPVASGTPDGEQDTGLYKSRFGKIEIKATIQGGLAKNYYMVINGKPVSAPGSAAKAADSCLKAKNVALPYQTQPAGACTGNRFRVVIDRSGAKPVAMFFGLQGDAWALCSATEV